MNISISYKNIESTEALEKHVREKIGSLEKFIKNEAAYAQVEIGKPSDHHNKGEVFYAEVNLELGGHLLRAESRHEDLYAAVNDARDKLEREFKDLKDKNQEKRRKKGFFGLF